MRCEQVLGILGPPNLSQNVNKEISGLKKCSESAPWPGNSPDMNPIEMAKDMITSKQQLIAKLIEVWNYNSKLQETVQECINSMPRRIKALIDAKGGTTKY